jgi:hypothetical protein
MLVGEAEVLIKANTKSFESDLRAQTKGGFTGLASNAETAGTDAGKGIRSGITNETSKLGNDLSAAGSNAGNKLKEGMSGPLSGVKSLLGGLGVPESMMGGFGLAAAGIGGVAAAAVDLGSKMQTANAQIATSSGISIKAANDIGNAFLNTAGKSEFSGQQMASAFASVAGQLKSSAGHALNTADAMKVMSAADELATAKHIELGTATSALAATMQAFHISAANATQATTVLFNASNATGQGVDAVGASLDKLKSKLGALAPPIGDMGALLVDLTNHGETGRMAMSALNTAFTAMLKPANAVAAAHAQEKIAIDALSPQLRVLATQYMNGSVTSTQVSAATKNLTTDQKNLWSQFTTSTTAVVAANQKQQMLGITMVDNRGKTLPMVDIMRQLGEKIKGMSDQQAIAQLSSMGFGASASTLLKTIQAGPDAYKKASDSVNNLDAVHKAAQAQAQTFAVQFDTLKAAAIDFGTKIGLILMPVLGDLMKMFSVIVPVLSDILKPAFQVLGIAVSVVAGVIKGTFSVFADVIDWFKKGSGAALAVAGVLTATLAPAFINMARKAVASATETMGIMALMAKDAIINAAKTVAGWFSIGTAAGVAEGEVAVAAAGIELSFGAIGSALGVLGAGFVAFEATTAFLKTGIGKHVGNFLTSGGSLNPITGLAGSIADVFNLNSKATANKYDARNKAIIKNYGHEYNAIDQITGAGSAMHHASSVTTQAYTAALTGFSKAMQTAIQNASAGGSGGGGGGSSSSKSSSKMSPEELALQRNGLDQLAIMVTDAHSKSLSILNSALDTTHRNAITALVTKLDATHNTALATLGMKIEAGTKNEETARTAALMAIAKTGTTALNSQLTLSQSTSLSALNIGLNKTHNDALKVLEQQLSAVHTTKMNNLVIALAEVHKEALANWAAQQAAAAANGNLSNAQAQTLIQSDQQTVANDIATMAGLTGDAAHVAALQLNVDQTKLNDDSTMAGLQATLNAATTTTAKTIAQTAITNAQAANQINEGNAAVLLSQGQAQQSANQNAAQNGTAPVTVGSAGQNMNGGQVVLNIQAGAVVIHPAAGNDAASINATKGHIADAFGTLAQRLNAGLSPLSAVGL